MAETGRIMVQGQPKQIVCEIPISKITTVKWTGDVARTVEHLLWMHKALGSNLTPRKNRKIRAADEQPGPWEDGKAGTEPYRIL
jgi:hypothetical protein